MDYTDMPYAGKYTNPEGVGIEPQTWWDIINGVLENGNQSEIQEILDYARGWHKYQLKEVFRHICRSQGSAFIFSGLPYHDNVGAGVYTYTQFEKWFDAIGEHLDLVTYTKGNNFITINGDRIQL